MSSEILGLQEYPPVLTVRQAADILQVSTKTICELCRVGALAGRKIGRLWRIPRPALAEFLSDEVMA
ncbi:helix-turn-helix domain-containing protein [Eggerthella guodeyinii]|uniref:Helix-turn-helix domain-containing protein n=1 Tax=Eggerthella guodeyinii TaxID=2690837 RepID=A0A6L7IM85_9ACTN|nr:helix-turn-helix domain-containing protein [Eggerthella guodeyinii]QOS68353.1 helix-turn-helix domain-containing protein [Eggerthella guodeyinii]